MGYAKLLLAFSRYIAKVNQEIVLAFYSKLLPVIGKYMWLVLFGRLYKQLSSQLHAG